MAEADHRQTIIATINGTSYRLKKRTRKNGHFHDWLSLKKDVIENSITTTNGVETVNFSVAIEGADAEPAESMLYLQPKQGISIISDIDDTIKDSFVSDRRELLANTFLREFKSVQGMAEVYNQWAAAGASFHYVSSSPWQLYHPLHAFLAEHGFPDGSFHLRSYRFGDPSILRLFVSRKRNKFKIIESIFLQFPERQFILVGDSGEKDAEIYGKVARRFPRQTKRILIRRVEGRPWTKKRIAKAFRRVPEDCWQTFKVPTQIRDIEIA